MRKKKAYTIAIVILLIVILVAVYFNFIRNTEEVYEGTLVWKGGNL